MTVVRRQLAYRSTDMAVLFAQPRDDQGRWASTAGGGFNRAPFDAARTTTELRDLLNTAMGGRGYVTGNWADRKLDVKQVRDMTATAAELFTKYPQVRANIEIGETTRGGTTHAETQGGRGGPTTMRFRPELLAKETPAATAKFRATVKSGWWHVVDPAATNRVTEVVTHEFGHALALTGHNQLQNTTVEALAKADPKGKLVKGVNASGYSLRNRSEAVAEAFTDVEINGAAAYPLSKTIHGLLTTHREGPRV